MNGNNKACPFCVGKDLELIDAGENEGGGSVVRCRNCGARGPSGTIKSCQEDWNKRMAFPGAFESMAKAMKNLRIQLEGFAGQIELDELLRFRRRSQGLWLI